MKEEVIWMVSLNTSEGKVSYCLIKCRYKWVRTQDKDIHREYRKYSQSHFNNRQVIYLIFCMSLFLNCNCTGVNRYINSGTTISKRYAVLKPLKQLLNDHVFCSLDRSTYQRSVSVYMSIFEHGQLIHALWRLV